MNTKNNKIIIEIDKKVYDKYIKALVRKEYQTFKKYKKAFPNDKAIIGIIWKNNKLFNTKIIGIQ